MREAPKIFFEKKRYILSIMNTAYSQRTRVFVFCMTMLFFLAMSAFGESPAGKGLSIAREADRRYSGFINQTADMKMLLRTKRGKESIRDLRVRILEIADDGDKSLMIFDRPVDVKGTALLTYSHKTNPDDQWLYLPALKRVKRIASKNKSGPFMGSEYSYEDMTPQEVEKYTYTYLRDEELNGADCYVIERVPIDKYSGYVRQVVWIDKAEYRPMKITYYDRKDTHLKTLLFSDYQKYSDTFWRPGNMFMKNHMTGKSTLLTWSNYQFQQDINENDFLPNSLKRIR